MRKALLPRNRRFLPNGKLGFTLLEVLLGGLVLAVATGVALQSFDQGQRLLAGQQEDLEQLVRLSEWEQACAASLSFPEVRTIDYWDGSEGELHCQELQDAGAFKVLILELRDGPGEVPQTWLHTTWAM